MFLGNIVQLSEDVTRPNSKEDTTFINYSREEDWYWLIVGMDDEELDYTIRPIYTEPESNSTELGATLSVLYDEIVEVSVTREEIFKKCNQMHCDRL